MPIGTKRSLWRQALICLRCLRCLLGSICHQRSLAIPETIQAIQKREIVPRPLHVKARGPREAQGIENGTAESVVYRCVVAAGWRLAMARLFAWRPKLANWHDPLLRLGAAPDGCGSPYRVAPRK